MADGACCIEPQEPGPMLGRCLMEHLTSRRPGKIGIKFSNCWHNCAVAGLITSHLLSFRISLISLPLDLIKSISVELTL